MTKSTVLEVMCEACGRRQLRFSQRMPQGLTSGELRMIGWEELSEDGDRPEGARRWLCPMHSAGGRKKLAAVASAARQDVFSGASIGRKKQRA
jgi:hypothetical protein